MSSFLSSLHISDVSPLSNVKLVEKFSHFVGYHFVRLIVSFALQKLCSIMRSHLLSVFKSMLNVFYSESLLWCLCVQGFSLLSLPPGSVYLDLLKWKLKGSFESQMCQIVFCQNKHMKECFPEVDTGKRMFL